MTPSAIYSKSGKGVQEASGKTSILSRGDRSVLSAFDGKLTVSEVAERVGKDFDAKFQQTIVQLEKDGFIRQVSAGAAPAAGPARPAAAARPAPRAGAAPGEDLDFTIAMPIPKAAPPADLAAKARADAERKAKEDDALSYKSRQEAEARAKAEADAKAKAELERAKAAAAARLQVEAAARSKAEAEARARAEADAKTRAAETDRVRAEADAKVKAAKDAAVRLATEAKAKAEAELQVRLEAERAKAREEAERIRKEAEEKARREFEESRKKAEEQARKESDELRQRLEEERKAREEAERKAKEAEDRRRKEEEERRAREEAERQAREEADRKAKVEAERRAREEAERRAKEEAERKAREKEEAERRAREDAERKAREKEEAERRAKEDADRKAREKEEADRRARDKEEAERRSREREEGDRRAREDRERSDREARERADKADRERADQERAARDKADRERSERERADRERVDRERAEKEGEQAAAKPADSFSDSLMADLDNFTHREDEEKKAKEDADRKAKAEAERRAREEHERKVEEDARMAREEAKRERKDAERRAKEEAERREAEEAERAEKEREKREGEERKRKARESVAAKAKEVAREKADEGGDGDIGITDEDLDMDEVKQDEKALTKEARRAAREREREKEREKDRERSPAKEYEAPVAPARMRRPMNWGKPVAIVLFLVLAGGIGAIHVMPISTAEYESAASEALGVPVKIGSGRISLFTGVQVNMQNVTVGGAKIARLRAYPEVGSLFSPKKTFSAIDVEEASVPLEALGRAVLAKAKGANFEVKRVNVRKLKVEGPLALPPFDADIRFGGEGEVRSASLRGPDTLLVKLAPAGSDIEVEVTADSFTVPFAPEISFNSFGMKGVASRTGMDIASWTASLYDGVLSGTAKLAWDGSWDVDGVVTARGVNVAVFAPALVSEGKVEGTGKFSMSGLDPAKLASSGHLEGNFTINKGVLGSIDISRALSTGGRQASGRTPFTELAGQGAYDKGHVALRNVTINAGALSAGASADIAPGGALTGRIVADVRTANQTLRATLAVGGTVKEPQVRN